jgi:hypothetical protein
MATSYRADLETMENIWTNQRNSFGRDGPVASLLRHICRAGAHSWTSRSMALITFSHSPTMSRAPRRKKLCDCPRCMVKGRSEVSYATWYRHQQKFRTTSRPALGRTHIQQHENATSTRISASDNAGIGISLLGSSGEQGTLLFPHLVNVLCNRD